MTMDTKHFEIEDLEAKEDGDTLSFEGFASVFNNVDSQKDIVLPGAFARTIKEKQPGDVFLLWQHNPHEPIGKLTALREEKRGLFVNGLISKTDVGVKAHRLLKDGVIRSMSIGYSPKKYSIDAKSGVRKLEDVDLWEVSLVTFPANPKANVTNVKSAPDNERDFEELLREAGYSRDAAKIIVARGFKALSGQREAEEQELAHIAAGKERLAHLFNQFKA